MISKPIPYGRQHITDEDIRAVIDTLKSDYLTQGPKIREFETKFAEYVGAQYAVAVNNATSGLHLAATALNVKPGDKVIVTPMTFAASANCIRYCGGEVVFCDIDKDTYLMDIRKLEAMLKASPRGTYKGIVPVDFCRLSFGSGRVQKACRRVRLVDYRGCLPCSRRLFHGQ